MQRYINQLIEDLQNAKKNVLPEPDFGDNYEHFEEKMFAMETAPDVPSKKLFGISYDELPPAERLTDDQKQQLIDAICDTWSVFGISVEFPESVPLNLRYELVRDKFACNIQYMPGWSMHYDFCSYWCPDCKIIDYCANVDEFWTKEELEEERKRVLMIKNSQAS